MLLWFDAEMPHYTTHNTQNREAAAQLLLGPSQGAVNPLYAASTPLPLTTNVCDHTITTSAVYNCYCLSSFCWLLLAVLVLAAAALLDMTCLSSLAAVGAANLPLMRGLPLLLAVPPEPLALPLLLMPLKLRLLLRPPNTGLSLSLSLSRVEGLPGLLHPPPLPPEALWFTAAPSSTLRARVANSSEHFVSPTFSAAGLQQQHSTREWDRKPSTTKVWSMTGRQRVKQQSSSTLIRARIMCCIVNRNKSSPAIDHQ